MLLEDKGSGKILRAMSYLLSHYVLLSSLLHAGQLEISMLTMWAENKQFNIVKTEVFIWMHGMCCFEVLLCGSEDWLGNLLLQKYFVGFSFGNFPSACSCEKNFVLLFLLIIVVENKTFA